MRSLTPARQRLVARYLPYARTLVGPLKAMYPWLRDELESEAYLALCQAALRYDASRGVKFGTYAYHRILGAARNLVAAELTESHQHTLVCREPAGRARADRSVVVRKENPGPALDSADALEALLEGFPASCRPLLRLIYVEGLSRKQAAARLRVHRTTVARRLGEALASYDPSPSTSTPPRLKNSRGTATRRKTDRVPS